VNAVEHIRVRDPRRPDAEDDEVRFSCQLSIVENLGGLATVTL
jgi:hypothetical protein